MESGLLHAHDGGVDTGLFIMNVTLTGYISGDVCYTFNIYNQINSKTLVFMNIIHGLLFFSRISYPVPFHSDNGFDTSSLDTRYYATNTGALYLLVPTLLANLFTAACSSFKTSGSQKSFI